MEKHPNRAASKIIFLLYLLT